MDKSKLTREIEFTAAWDKRAAEPAKNYGVHGVEMRWYLKGPEGAIQFVVYTNWQLPHVAKWHETMPGGSLNRPMGADLGFHSHKPVYDGQKPMAGECHILGGQCYYDGSGLQAEELLGVLIEKGGEAVWNVMEERYETWLLKPELETENGGGPT